MDKYRTDDLLAKLMALTAIDLLNVGTQDVKAILVGYKPLVTKDAYLAFMRSDSREETFKGE